MPVSKVTETWSMYAAMKDVLWVEGRRDDTGPGRMLLIALITRHTRTQRHNTILVNHA